MHHYFVHQSRWLLLLTFLLSLQVLADPCINCGRKLEPGKGGKMACRACNSEMFVSPSPSPSPSANEDSRGDSARPKAPKLTIYDAIAYLPSTEQESYIARISLGEDEDLLVAEIQANAMTLDTAAEDVGDELRVIADDPFKMSAQQEKQLEVLQKLHQAQVHAGADETKVIPAHKIMAALTEERAEKIIQSPWSTDLLGIGLTHLVSAVFQNTQLVIDLTSLIQSIQQGHAIQLIITHMVVAEEGNQAAAGTITPVMFGAIIPDPTMNDHTEHTDMHMLLGGQPVHVNQHTLLNVLIAVMKALGEKVQNAQLSLHIFQCPQMDTRDKEDPPHQESME